MAGPFTAPVAVAVPFDGSEKSDGTSVTPSFVSDNVRDGIIEAREEAIGKVRATRTFMHNGTLGNNFWHGYDSTINSFDTPMLIPWNCIWKEYTFSADQNSIDGTMEFYLNGTSAGDIFHTVTFNDVDVTKIDFPNIMLSQGDIVRARWNDQGTNPSDVVSTFDFQLT